MRTRAVSLLIASCVLLSTHVQGASMPKENDPWKNLEIVTHTRSYTFMERGGKCVYELIMSVTDEGATLKQLVIQPSRLPTTALVQIERSNILRVMDGPKAIDVVYSGRSSWSDVLELRGIPWFEDVVFIMKDGTRRKGKVKGGSVVEVKLASSEKMLDIPKSDVQKVYYMRGKPPSAGAMYAAQEMVFLDPRLWPYMIGIPPKIYVLMYDASGQQDDAPVSCKNSP